jgi:hypothetical protein
MFTSRDSVPLLTQVSMILCICRAISLLVNIDFYTSGLNSKSGRVLSPKIEDGCQLQGQNAQELFDSGRPAKEC